MLFTSSYQTFFTKHRHPLEIETCPEHSQVLFMNNNSSHSAEMKNCPFPINKGTIFHEGKIIPASTPNMSEPVSMARSKQVFMYLARIGLDMVLGARGRTMRGRPRALQHVLLLLPMHLARIGPAVVLNTCHADSLHASSWHRSQNESGRAEPPPAGAAPLAPARLAASLRASILHLSRCGSGSMSQASGKMSATVSA